MLSPEEINQQRKEHFANCEQMELEGQLFPRPQDIKYVDQKSSGRFTFIKPATSDSQVQSQSNRERIRETLKGKLCLIIDKPTMSVEQMDQESGIDLSTTLNVMRPGMQLLAKKLEVQLNLEDQEYIFSSTKEFFSNYEVRETLGEGCIGLVKRAVHRQSNQHFAVKIVATTDEEIIRNMIIEFKSMLRLSHENIVKMFKLYIDYNDGFQSESRAYVVMELIEGKEMFEVINENGHYSEADARRLFKQLLSAIECMHRNGICHRDLKPHNILCVKDNQMIKVTDFNVSKFSDNYKEFGDLSDCEKIEMWTYTGTVAFSAPEIFTGEGYTQMVDMWSAGCILYAMVCGQLPFNADQQPPIPHIISYHNSLNDLVQNICDAQYTFPQELFSGVSKEAKSLIKKLLEKEPTLRPHPDEALRHPWFSEVFTNPNLNKQINKNCLVKKSTLKKLSMKENILHFTSKNAVLPRQRQILLNLCSSSLIHPMSHDVFSNHKSVKTSIQFMPGSLIDNRIYAFNSSKEIPQINYKNLTENKSKFKNDQQIMETSPELQEKEKKYVVVKHNIGDQGDVKQDF